MFSISGYIFVDDVSFNIKDTAIAITNPLVNDMDEAKEIMNLLEVSKYIICLKEKK